MPKTTDIIYRHTRPDAQHFTRFNKIIIKYRGLVDGRKAAQAAMNQR